jgi:hypothetical protein
MHKGVALCEIGDCVATAVTITHDPVTLQLASVCLWHHDQAAQRQRELRSQNGNDRSKNASRD